MLIIWKQNSSLLSDPTKWDPIFEMNFILIFPFLLKVKELHISEAFSTADGILWKPLTKKINLRLDPIQGKGEGFKCCQNSDFLDQFLVLDYEFSHTIRYESTESNRLRQKPIKPDSNGWAAQKWPHQNLSSLSHVQRQLDLRSDVN